MDIIQKKRNRERENKWEREGTAPVARQASCCLFPEIFFTTVFGIKSLNNLLFNKFKCKTTPAARERKREKRIFALAHPTLSTPPSPPPQPTTLKVCSPDHRHAYFMRRGRELWWKDGGVTVSRSWSVYCPHQRLIIMSACKIAWYYLILLENWNSCRGGRGRSPPWWSRLQPSGLSGRRAPSLQDDQRGLGSVRT